MLISSAYPFTSKGKPAQMYVIKNDGFCWGRAVFQDGTNFDVEYRTRDLYDASEDYAAECFINKARRGGLEEPMTSWRLQWDGSIE